MATQQIKVEFDLALPNDFLVDHSTSANKTRKSEYNGPDKIYLQIGADGKEVAGPLTEDDIIDGRPMPADCVDWMEIDCATDPLVCQLRGPVSNEVEEEYTGETTHPGSPVVTGYPQFSYATPLMPGDIYNKNSMVVVDGSPTFNRYTVPQKLHDKDADLTWADIRKHRNQMLEQTDSRTGTDMPESLLNDWKEYRVLLRDLPATLEAAGVEPNIAYYMFPSAPDVAAE